MPKDLPSTAPFIDSVRSHWRKIKAVRSWGVYVWIVIALTLIGGFLRLYKLSDTVMFLGDQGRDAIVVSRIFTDADPVFIGPVMSVGNLYIGPLYYYFMMPFLWLSYPSPMGPVYAVAIIGTLMIPMMYFLGSRLIGKRAAFFATFLLALSSSTVSLARFSWNPNLMPFFGLVWVYCLYHAALGKRWYWVAVALVLAILIQLHYISFLAVGVSGLVWVWRLVVEARHGKWKILIGPTLIGLGIVLAFQLPLFLFDTKHDWLNARMFIKLLQGDDAFASNSNTVERAMQIIEKSKLRISQLLIGVTFAYRSSTAVYAAYAMLGAAVVFWIRESNQTARRVVQLLLLIVCVSLLGLSLYKNEVYLHYLGFLLPTVFLLMGYVLEKLLRIHKLQIVTVGLLLSIYAWQNLASVSFVGGGPRLPMLAATADAIHARVEPGEQYSILLISQSKDMYGLNYRYFLTTNHEKQPLEPEQYQFAKKLFVLWEDKEVAEPLSLPLYELIVFNVATPSAVFDIPDGPTVLELRKD